MGAALPDRQCLVARCLGSRDPVLRISPAIRKIIKTRGHFPSNEAATKLIWLALRNITAGWGHAAHDWKAAMNQLALLYEEHFARPSV